MPDQNTFYTLVFSGWAVRYEIADRTYTVGPWNIREAEYHRRDISTYAGVSNVELIQVGLIGDPITFS